MQFGIRTGLIGGFVLGAAIMVAPGCEMLGLGQQMSPEQMAQVRAIATAQVAQINTELEQLRGEYQALLDSGTGDPELNQRALTMIEGLESKLDLVMPLVERVVDQAVNPDGSIDVAGGIQAAAPLLAMVPGLNFIVPMLPILGGLAGWFHRNKAVKFERSENAENLTMAEQLSIGSIGIIDSIQELKAAMPSNSEAGTMLRNVLANQPQQSRFLVNAVRGTGFAGERMGPLLKSAQGKLANQRRAG